MKKLLLIILKSLYYFLILLFLAGLLVSYLYCSNYTNSFLSQIPVKYYELKYFIGIMLPLILLISVTRGTIAILQEKLYLKRCYPVEEYLNKKFIPFFANKMTLDQHFAYLDFGKKPPCYSVISIPDSITEEFSCKIIYDSKKNYIKYYGIPDKDKYSFEKYCQELSDIIQKCTKEVNEELKLTIAKEKTIKQNRNSWSKSEGLN